MKQSPLAFIGRHPKLVLTVIFAITAFFLYQTTMLTLDADYTTLMAQSQSETTFDGGVGNLPSAGSAIDHAEDNIIPETTALSTRGQGNHLVASVGETSIPEEPEFTSSYLVMVESANLYTPENLTLIEKTMNSLQESGYVSAPFSVLDFITLEKKGTRLVTVPFSASQPWDDEKAALLKQRLEEDPIVKGYLVSEDLTNLIFSFESLA
ncbi:MAG: RND transporter, partial [Spirochaetales bacterium]|nr:RND transporter [Spirochaetales bacterium]